MKLDIYELKRKQLLSVFQQLADMASALQLNVQEQQAKKAMDMLMQEQFHMAVVGEFSRGKSTFVNALLGKNILPSSKSPTTAIISQIVYGRQPEFTLYYKNELPPRAISQEEFSNLKAPKEGIMKSLANTAKFIGGKIKNTFSQNDFNRAQAVLAEIDHALIKYPLEFCKNQVELVDTPGTNDLNTGRIEITYRYLDQADALIMLLAADQALSASEVEFIKERILKKKIQDIFFIINRKDTLHGPEEEQNVLNFVRTNLKAILPESMSGNIHLFLVSSYQALLFRKDAAGEALTPKQTLKKPTNLDITGFPELETALGRFLSEEKGNAKLKKYIHIGQEIQAGINETLALRRNISAQSVDEIREKVAAMEPEFLDMKHRAKKIISTLKSSLEAAESNLENECTLAGDRLLTVAKKTVDDYTGRMDANDVKKAVDKAITPEQKKWIETMKSKQSELVSKEVGKAEASLRLIWADLQNVCGSGKELDTVDNPQITFDIKSSEHERTYDDEEKGLWCVGAGVVAAFLGAPVLAVLGLGALGANFFGWFSDSRETVRNKIKNEIAEQYTEQAKSVKEKVLNSYREQSKNVCTEMQSFIDNRIDDMHNQLQVVLKEKEAQEKDAANELRTLTGHINALEQCSRQLIALKK